jgi:hypothetical protein
MFEYKVKYIVNLNTNNLYQLLNLKIIMYARARSV